jgi:predicted membrane-bound mannosyltransferase
MGYWIAQQEVARGNQPWYYYFVGLSVYELLSLVFGTLGAIYSLKRGDVFGLALAFWTGLTLLAYTIGSEKMPWLLVNITLPFILLAGRYLGVLAEAVPWHQVVRQGQVLLLVLIPLGITGAVYLVRRYVNVQGSFSVLEWSILAGLALLAILSAYLVRLAHPRAGMAMVGLGAAALLLAFGTWAAFRAAYTIDDSRREILVYAQGSADLKETYHKLKQRILESPSHTAPALVDYEMWYPFQWYVRQRSERKHYDFLASKKITKRGGPLDAARPQKNPMRWFSSSMLLMLIGTLEL